MLYVFKKSIEIHIPAYNLQFGALKSVKFAGNSLVLKVENASSPDGTCAPQGKDIYGELREQRVIGMEGRREKPFQDYDDGR